MKNDLLKTFQIAVVFIGTIVGAGLASGKEITEEDILQKEKQIESLKQSINKRKQLLANENFVKKAPEKLVAEEKAKLENDEKLLELLTQ